MGAQDLSLDLDGGWWSFWHLGFQDGNFDADSVVAHPGRTDRSQRAWVLGEGMWPDFDTQVAGPTAILWLKPLGFL